MDIEEDFLQYSRDTNRAQKIYFIGPPVTTRLPQSYVHIAYPNNKHLKLHGLDFLLHGNFSGSSIKLIFMQAEYCMLSMQEVVSI